MSQALLGFGWVTCRQKLGALWLEGDRYLKVFLNKGDHYRAGNKQRTGCVFEIQAAEILEIAACALVWHRDERAWLAGFCCSLPRCLPHQHFLVITSESVSLLVPVSHTLSHAFLFHFCVLFTNLKSSNPEPTLLLLHLQFIKQKILNVLACQFRFPWFIIPNLSWWNSCSQVSDLF